MKSIIHVNQHVIKSNAKRPVEEAQPCLTIKTYKEQTNGHTAKIYHEGVMVAEIIYRPHKPLSCGAHCWVETPYTVVIDDERQMGAEISTECDHGSGTCVTQCDDCGALI